MTNIENNKGGVLLSRVEDVWLRLFFYHFKIMLETCWHPEGTPEVMPEDMPDGIPEARHAGRHPAKHVGSKKERTVAAL